MNRPLVVLTVCLGNICRSPTAAAAIVEAAAASNVEVEVRSAGTGGWHVGNPPDARMRRAAQDAGLELTGLAEQVDAQAIDDADLVVVMDRQNLADVEAVAASAAVKTPVRLFRTFDPDADGDLEVPDPYYGGEQGFIDVVGMCRRAAHGVVAWLDRDPAVGGPTSTDDDASPNPA